MDVDQIRNETGFKRSHINKIKAGYGSWLVKKRKVERANRLKNLPLGMMVEVYGEKVQFVRYSKTHAYFNLDNGRGKQSNMLKEDFIGDVIL
jgi:hypothetical protein